MPRQNSVITNGNTVPPEEAKSQQPSMDQLTEVVAELNNHVQSIKRDLHFSIDDASGNTVIRVVNSETEELVRQIPSEEVLRISQTIKEQSENLSGLIFEISA
ncbi:MAG: flagellar protein FlaG [Gammaproteobacteria bacterium]|nr:flagellar protein FlaG [Gammaproteobacteria bacterium]